MSMFENIQRGSDAFPRGESGMSTIDCSVIQLILLALAVESRSWRFRGAVGDHPVARFAPIMRCCTLAEVERVYW